MKNQTDQLGTITENYKPDEYTDSKALGWYKSEDDE